MRKDEYEHKNVVHAQRVFDQIAGKKIEPVVWPFETPDDTIKSQQDDHPQEAAAAALRPCSIHGPGGGK